MQPRIGSGPPAIRASRRDAAQAGTESGRFEARTDRIRKRIDALPGSHESTIPNGARQVEGMRSRSRQLAPAGHTTSRVQQFEPFHGTILDRHTLPRHRPPRPVEKARVWKAGEIARRAACFSDMSEKQLRTNRISDGARKEEGEGGGRRGREKGEGEGGGGGGDASRRVRSARP